ncbi:MAG TPA: response regulator [Nannocystis exedens]|nr:response regulator [Nannocystis exedens]
MKKPEPPRNLPETPSPSESASLSLPSGCSIVTTEAGLLISAHGDIVIEAAASTSIVGIISRQGSITVSLSGEAKHAPLRIGDLYCPAGQLTIQGERPLRVLDIRCRKLHINATLEARSIKAERLWGRGSISAERILIDAEERAMVFAGSLRVNNDLCLTRGELVLRGALFAPYIKVPRIRAMGTVEVSTLKVGRTAILAGDLRIASLSAEESLQFIDPEDGEGWLGDELGPIRAPKQRREPALTRLIAEFVSSPRIDVTAALGGTVSVLDVGAIHGTSQLEIDVYLRALTSDDSGKVREQSHAHALSRAHKQRGAQALSEQHPRRPTRLSHLPPPPPPPPRSSTNRRKTHKNTDRPRLAAPTTGARPATSPEIDIELSAESEVVETTPYTLYCLDDDPMSRLLVERSAKRAGMEVESFPTVAAVKERLSKCLPDVIFVDGLLPDGTGFDVIRSLRQSGSDAPQVIFCSGFLDDLQIFQKLRILGVEIILRKPVEVDKLTSHLLAFKAQAFAEEHTEEG